MIFLRKVKLADRSKTRFCVMLPPFVSKQIGLSTENRDVMFEFQPGKKEVLLTKSPYDSQQNNRPWTKEEIELLKNLCKDGITQELAVRFGRSRQAVWSKAKKLRFTIKKLKSPKPWPDGKKELFIKLYPSTSNKELAKMFGRSVGVIQQKANRLGL